MLRIGDFAPDPVVTTTDDRRAALSSLRRGALTIYTFVRHLG